MNAEIARAHRARIASEIAMLQAKLANLNAVQKALTNEDLLPFLDESKLFPDQPKPTEANVEYALPAKGLPKRAYRMPNRGVRAAVTRHLMTGPASAADLCRVLAFSQKAVLVAIAGGLESRIYREEGGILSLTTEGIVQGKWLMEHPLAKLYAVDLPKEQA